MAANEQSAPSIAVSEQHNIRTAGKPNACRQCRARKVKCDRRLTGCLHCARLKYVCSYISGGDATVMVAESASPQELTQAGTKRRRIRRACEACRSMKTKCSGEQPCSRCKSLSYPCHFRNNEHRSSPISASPQQASMFTFSNADAEDHELIPTPGTICSRTSEAFRTFNPTNKDLVKKYLNAYFDSSEYRDWPILHRATIMLDWQQDRIEASLLKIICATGLRNICVEQLKEQDLTLALTWAHEVQSNVLTRLETLNVSDLQVLILIIRLRFTFSATQGIWVLLSLVSRMAFTKGLNYEIPNADPVKQECLRRLMWAVYDLDKIYCGGIEDLTLCPTHRMHIRLPNNESYFQRGLRSRSRFFSDFEGEDNAYMDSLAYRLRLLDIRDRILRYTRRVVLERSSPIHSQEELRSLDSDLMRFRQSLPEDLQENTNKLILMHHSGDLRSYVLLHTMIHLCRCDLYRFLIPGIKEAISQVAFTNTPQAYAELCQRECLRSAIKLCDLWSQVYHLESHGPIHHPTMAIAIYQCAKIVQRLYELLPESTEYSLADVKTSLSEAVEMVLPSLHSHQWIAPCITDLQRLIPLLGIQGRVSATPPNADMQDHRSQAHRRSNYVFGPKTESSAAILATSSQRQSTNLSNPLITTGNARSSDAAVWTGNGAEDVSLEHPDMLMFLDPFDIQLNPYFDMDVSSSTSAGFT